MTARRPPTWPSPATPPIRTPVVVILPTHDHAGTLGYAMRSVLQQTFADLTLVVIGDGVGDDTRDVVREQMADDERIRFVDRPKAPRHGEVLRHEVLASVDSPVVGYQGDDDLLLPRHLERTLEVLDGHDFAHPLPTVVESDGRLTFLPTDLARPECVAWHLSPARRNAVSLTGAVHTTAAYRRLPHGWRETPAGEWTDHYMWKQFFELDGLSAVTGEWATTIKLGATHRKDVSADERVREIASWWRRVHEPGFDESWETEVRRAVARAAVDATLAVTDLQDAVVGFQKAHDEAVAQRDRLLAEHDEAVTQRDGPLIARDKALAARRRAVRQRDRALADGFCVKCSAQDERRLGADPEAGNTDTPAGSQIPQPVTTLG